jgi:AraC-like DNA-binding protein
MARVCRDERGANAGGRSLRRARAALATQVLGEPLHQFLRKKQVEHAARLLLRRIPLSVEEIAARSAFGTRSAMHRWFVKVHGVGPAAFRERTR